MSRRLSRCLRRAIAIAQVLGAISATIALADDLPSNEAARAEEALHRAFLEWEVGTWSATVTLVDLEGGEDTVFPARQTDRLGACGLWLITDLAMEAPAPGVPAPPYEGHGVLGFDPREEGLVGIWVDSKTNWLATASGQVDSDGKRLVLEVDGRHPVTGDPETQRFVTTRVGDDRRRLEINIGTPQGGEVTVAVIEYTRLAESEEDGIAG